MLITFPFGKFGWVSWLAGWLKEMIIAPRSAPSRVRLVLCVNTELRVK